MADMADTTITRYRRLRNGALVCDAAGEWVRYEDHHAALTAAHAARDAAERYIATCENMIRRHAKAADIFQPGGRFHERANLLLGDSAVVAGIAWLSDEHDRLTAQLTTALRERNEALAAVPETVYVVQHGVMDYYGPYLSEFPVYVSRDDAEAAINAPGVRPEDHQIEALPLARAKRLTA